METIERYINTREKVLRLDILEHLTVEENSGKIVVLMVLSTVKLHMEFDNLGMK